MNMVQKRRFVLCCVLRAKEDGDLRACGSAFSSKASISDGMGVHKCIRYD